MTESRPSVPLSTGINRAREEKEEEDEETQRDFINSVVHLIGALLNPTAKMKSEMSSNEKTDVRRGKKSWGCSYLENNLGQNQDFVYTIDPRDSLNSHNWILIKIGQRSF